jgi:hypothetical protein
VTAPDQQPPTYPAPEPLYAIEVGNYLEKLLDADRVVVEGCMEGLSPKDQWELLQSFHVDDEVSR